MRTTEGRLSVVRLVSDCVHVCGSVLAAISVDRARKTSQAYIYEDGLNSLGQLECTEMNIYS
jgi:hypothetical protein